MEREVEKTKSLEELEIGMFSIRHFVLEMIMAQDGVLSYMDQEQEQQLVTMSREWTKIERDNPIVFCHINAVSTYLMYAKMLVNTSGINSGMRASLSNFIKTPQHIDEETMRALDDHITENYK